MLEFAPRIQLRLLDEIERLSRRRAPIAEINRLVGAAAARMSLPKPSYEQVRVLVHLARRFRRASPPGVSTVAAAVVFRTMPPAAIADRIFAAPAHRLRDRAPRAS
ncbi:MAG TPA: hypothetical protein VJ986_05860 [Gaiellaceae bacterium]|nr:hypothetical protein [Gaiellaceae bacterium]